MVSNTKKLHQKFAESEVGTIRKSWRGRIRVALVYPNRYSIGMSNLGFQAIYHLLNTFEHVVCERVFLPENNRRTKNQLKTFESGKPLTDTDIIAFSLSFENDYPHILSILESAGIPFRSSARKTHDPLVIAGGIACFLNPEPIAPFIDCFLIGEAESILSQFLDVFELKKSKKSLLKIIAQNVPGAYVPAFYKTDYNSDGTLAAFTPLENVPQKIKRVFLKDLSQVSTHSAVITPHTTFGSTFLVEVGRGCPHGCRFCAAGFIYRPPRFRPVSLLENNMKHGVSQVETIGLVGAAVSDLPDIRKLCQQFLDTNVRISFSSLRADRLAPELLSILKQSNVKTATIAPEAGTERLRDVIHKGITEEDVLDAAAALVENDIPNVKLYFMVGLPTETEADVDGIITLCKRIKHRFLKSSRARKRIGEITVSLNAFVPKPFTPFQWVAMQDVNGLKTKLKKVKGELRKVANVRVHADVPRWAYIQALFARGDRRVADILTLAHTNKGNWVQTLKTVPMNPDFYVLRQRNFDELLPWDFVDHDLKKSFLWKEYQKAESTRV
ncbi:MAG: TIGR03960 family B12-binding radical SAM protein [Desulfobacterales bacterium]|nr:MAG: TIGR03960 family B12-binding radical SAM protein [Desulfobacterales bacterium]